MKTSVIALIAAAVAIAAIAGAAFFMLNGNGSEDVKVTGIQMESEAGLTVGSTYVLEPKILPSNASNKSVSWKTSDASVATVDGGTVKGISAGTAVITATTADSGKTASCTVTVSDHAIEVTGIALDHTTLEIASGSSEKLSVIFTPSNATDRKVAWTSSDPKVATVSDGTVTAVADGNAVITATSSSGGHKATCEVSVYTSKEAKPITLSIFGNANEDQTIDQKDLDLIRSLIGDKKAAAYPYADADRDGKITDKDAEIVKKIIAGEETQVTFIDHYYLVAGETRYVTVDYPLKDIVTQNADMLLLTMMIDADDQVAGFVANVDNYPNEFYKVTHNKTTKQIGSTARYLSAADWTAIKNLDIELQSKGSKIGAIVVHSDSSLGDYKDDILRVGFPLIYLRCTDPVYSFDAAVLLGALMGPDHAAKARAYANDCRSTVEDVRDAVMEVPDEDRKRFIALCMVCYIAQSESQYTNIGTEAGGKEMSGLAGNTSVRLQDTEAITKYNDKIDYILNCRTADCDVVDPAELWEDSGVRYIEKSSHYKDMVWVNMSMPISCRVVYVASLFYPSIISGDAADRYFQNVVDKYMPYLHNTEISPDGRFDVKTDMFTLIDYQDYLDSKGGDIPDSGVVSEISSITMANRFLSEMDFTGYNGTPYSIAEGSNDQEASVVPSSGKYQVKYKLYKDAGAQFDSIKAEYESKIGTQSGMGGTYQKVETPSGFTEGIGYYVNVPDGSGGYKIGSFYYAGYYKECLAEIHLAKTGIALTESDFENILSAAWGMDGSVSAIRSAEKFDLSLLGAMKGSPYAISSDSDDMKAKIMSTAAGPGKEYYIQYDNNAGAAVEYESKKAEFEEKNGTDYMGGKRIAIGTCGFDGGAGFYGNTDRGFSMIQYVGVKDGCYATIYLRMDNAAFDDASAEKIVGAVAASIA